MSQSSRPIAPLRPVWPRPQPNTGPVTPPFVPTVRMRAYVVFAHCWLRLKRLRRLPLHIRYAAN
jgi:hypothetical protein